MEFYKRYSFEVPCTEDYRGEKVEERFANLLRRKSISDQRYERFVQLCTDKEGSASDMCSVMSKRSSASSLARKQEMIELQLKQTELCLELEEARVVARMELLKLKEAMSSSSRWKRKKQLQCRDGLVDNSPNESGCGMEIGKDVTSLLPGNAVSTREATTASCIISRSPATTIDPQPVTSKVDVVDKKPNFSVEQDTPSRSNVCFVFQWRIGCCRW